MWRSIFWNTYESMDFYIQIYYIILCNKISIIWKIWNVALGIKLKAKQMENIIGKTK